MRKHTQKTMFSIVFLKYIEIRRRKWKWRLVAAILSFSISDSRRTDGRFGFVWSSPCQLNYFATRVHYEPMAVISPPANTNFDVGLKQARNRT